jgi:hypothetical protein
MQDRRLRNLALNDWTMRSYWRRLPIVVRAVLAGSLFATLGTVPKALLGEANLRFLTSVPWAVPAAALYIWAYWRYVVTLVSASGFYA